MWYLEKDVTIAASHFLVGYVGKCAQRHGHNWFITVYCKGDELDKDGILVDFSTIKAAINKYDHKELNDLMPEGVNSTAENLAKIICEEIPHCWKVMVQESVGARAIYIPE